MNEQKLIEKLRRIEALFAGSDVSGEKAAAADAYDRIRRRLAEVRKADPPVEYKFTMGDLYKRRLFVALLRRYGIEPFRYARQRYTTVMAHVPQNFVDEILWPEFQELSSTLDEYLDQVTNRVISEAVHGDTSEASERRRLSG
jgi:hypothetical protein